MKTASHNCREFAHKAITQTFFVCAALLLAGCATGLAPRLHQAAADGKLDIVQAEVKRGADVNRDYGTFGTPLHQASISGHAEVAQWLIQNGAAVDGPPKSGMTPLYNSARHGRDSVAAVLITNGANVNYSWPYSGQTVLLEATATNSAEIIRLLLRHGAAVNQTNAEGWSPVHVAAERGNTNVLLALLEAGGNLNAGDNEGFTPLHTAAENSNVETVKLLIAKGANLAVFARTNLTPLHSAAKQGLEPHAISTALVEAGAPTNAVEWVPAASAAAYWAFADNAVKRGDKTGASAYYEMAATYFDRAAQQFRKKARGSTGKGILQAAGKGILLGLGATAASTGNVYLGAHTASADVNASRATTNFFDEASEHRTVADHMVAYAVQCRKLASAVK